MLLTFLESGQRLTEISLKNKGFLLAHNFRVCSPGLESHSASADCLGRSYTDQVSTWERTVRDELLVFIWLPLSPIYPDIGPGLWNDITYLQGVL